MDTPEEFRTSLEKNRFVLSHESFSKTRLKELRKEFVSLHSNYPALVGLNIYGSMTKGYATSESDVDILTFIDTDLIPNQEEYRERYGDSFIDTVVTRLTSAMDINKDSSLSTIFFNYRTLSEDLGRLVQELEFLETRHPEDLFDRLQTAPRLPTQLTGVTGRISAFFTGISLGHDLRKYRKYLLDDLESKGLAGEQVWQLIILYVERFERPELNGQPEAIETIKPLYPQSILGARKYYSL